MSKRLKICWLTLASLVIIAGIGLYAFRLSLLEILISHQLHKQGIKVHSLSVEAVSFNSLLLCDLSVGADHELQADNILISWHVRDLLAGELTSVEIMGLQVALDLSGERPSLGFLQPLLSSTGKNTGSLRLPAISLLDSALHVRSAWGDITIALTGNLGQAQPNAQAAQLSAEIVSSLGRIHSILLATLDAQGNFEGQITVSASKLSLPRAQIANLTGEAAFAMTATRLQSLSAELALADILLTADKSAEPASGHHFEQGRLHVQLDESHGRLSGALRTINDTFVVNWNGTVQHYLGNPDIDLALTANGIASHFPWQLLGLAQANKGSLALVIKSRGQIPSVQEFTRHSLNDLSWLQHSALTGQAQLELHGISFPQKMTNLHGKLGLDVTFAREAGKVALMDDSVFQVSRLDPAWLANLGLPVDMAIGQIILAGAIDGSLTSWTGQLNLHAAVDRLATRPLLARQVSVALPLQISFDQDIWHMGLQKAWQVTVGTIDPFGPINIQGPLALSIPLMEVNFKKGPRGLTFNHHIVGVPTAFTLLADRQDAPMIEARIHPGKITLRGKCDAGEPYQGQGILNRMNLSLPQLDIHLENIATTLHLGASETNKIADFTIGRLHHQADTPFFAPISIGGSIQPMQGKAGRYSMSATGSIAESRYLTLSGKHAFDSGKGELKIEIASLEFLPGSLQPESFIPALAELANVSGVVSANVLFKWSKDGIHSSGVLDIDRVSFAYQATQITGLDATLHLNDVLSPTSPPQQIITIRRIDVGIPMESLVISYRIEGEPPKIILEKVNLFWLGGIVSLKPTMIDPFAARIDIVVLIDNIDLAVLFDLIQVEGLTGNGRLDGSIPITLEGNQIAILDGSLRAEIPGVLHFQSEKASQLLAGAGKEMNLLLQAMQDFHYTELTLKLNKSVTHDLVATLSLLGNNPNVIEGQMFHLNINLESNIGKILESISQGYRLSNEILRDLFRLR